MVNQHGKKVSTKARLLMALREQAGRPVSGSVLASEIGVSRVAVWKGIQSLSQAGYPIETGDSGYAIDPAKAVDFLYPWEFSEKEAVFRHYDNLGSTMDMARESALQGLPAGTVITAERQNAGRGRNGRTWASRRGGLFFTVLERPVLAMPDYPITMMVYQIAVARALGHFCGKPARLRWPNDVYIDKRKIAGVMAELEGEGDSISWLAMGIGINVNNHVPSQKAGSCAGIAGHPLLRRDILLKVLDEAEKVRGRTISGMAYAQGNRLLAAEWNSLADCMGAKAAVIYSGFDDSRKDGATDDVSGRILARGIFAGIDPAGRCIINSAHGKDALYFNPGPISIVFLSH
ncbi:MAG: biotin--[acetyl-CoA-carboxylase] ligase [Treponema sp.]|jgi:BirA family biotin operon repressor/biotin-[acetyl-CoA-carboxylase] ligase|nr:biotin--[acetyl-CoA-carboxylase] ligase [Treponema sp.]